MKRTLDSEGEILGQGRFRYRVNRFWGRLDPVRYPVVDCHGVAEDKAGRVLVLTNETRNNFLAYNKRGELLTTWEHRFPKAHGLELREEQGEEVAWITDHGIAVVSKCTLDGRELRRVGYEAVAALYPDREKYRPTNVAVMPEGDFYVSDGYGSHFVHHFDPDWRYISTFGGVGPAPENFRQPHAVWHDTRPGKPPVLVCDRGNAALKWFSREGRLERIVPLPGAKPSNVALWRDGHLIIPSIDGMILVLDGDDRVVSVIGGEAPRYEGGVLQPIRAFNYSLFHPHDVHIDTVGDLYVVQWNSNNTYPLKLERLPA